MTDWLLSPEEITETINKLGEDANYQAGLNAVARAQAKQMVLYLESHNLVAIHGYTDHGLVLSVDSWQSLKQEVKGE